MKNYRFLYLLVALTFICNQKILSQGKYKNKQINCDSLLSILNREGGYIDKYPSTLKPLNEIENEFMSKIKPNRLENSIYTIVIIDTLGDVSCAKILKGTNTEMDTVALKYVTTLKFSPAEYRGKKKVVPVVIPLLKSSLEETKKMKKINGQWIMKENDKK